MICRGDYLPEAGRFRTGKRKEDMEWEFGTMGLRDKARYMATLYLEDISDLIVECVDPKFGFSRYAEHLGRSASSFDALYEELHQPLSFTDRHLVRLLEEQVESKKPEIMAITIPFPGNLYSALRCGEWIKQHRPDLKVMMGSGFANTERRSIHDRRFFEYTDFLMLDDGEDTLYRCLRYVEKQIPESELIRTFTLDEKREQVVYRDCPLSGNIAPQECGTPDYIKRYVSTSATILVDRMEQTISETGEIGFHFVDEAAPPALLKEVATEMIKRKLTVVWWGNVRFEKSFTPELCFLLKSSGCIAISGGLEVASDRLLKFINKGVSIRQETEAT